MLLASPELPTCRRSFLAGTLEQILEDITPVLALLGEVLAGAVAVITLVFSAIGPVFLAGSTATGASGFRARDAHQADIVRHEHPGAVDREEVTVEAVKHGARRVVMMVGIRHHRHVLGTILGRLEGEGPSDSHFLTDVLKPHSALCHPARRHEEVCEDHVPVRELGLIHRPVIVLIELESVRLVLVEQHPLAHFVILHREQANCLFVRGAVGHVVTDERLPSSDAVNRAVVDNQNLHDSLHPQKSPEERVWQVPDRFERTCYPLSR